MNFYRPASYCLNVTSSYEATACRDGSVIIRRTSDDASVLLMPGDDADDLFYQLDNCESAEMIDVICSAYNEVMLITTTV